MPIRYRKLAYLHKYTHTQNSRYWLNAHSCSVVNTRGMALTKFIGAFTAKIHLSHINPAFSSLSVYCSTMMYVGYKQIKKKKIKAIIIIISILVVY